jgi:hypothetical protein
MARTKLGRRRIHAQQIDVETMHLMPDTRRQYVDPYEVSVIVNATGESFQVPQGAHNPRNLRKFIPTRLRDGVIDPTLEAHSEGQVD